MSHRFDNKWRWLEAAENGYLVCMSGVRGGKIGKTDFESVYFADSYNFSLQWEFPEPFDDEEDLACRELLMVHSVEIGDPLNCPRNWVVA